MERTTDHRENFVNTFVSESPEGIPKTSLADKIEYFISDYKKTDRYEVKQLSNGLKKLEGTQFIFYWYEDTAGKMTLGVELEKAPYAVIVREIGKYVQNCPPYASDLYNAILADRKNIEYTTNSIRIMSDKQLSDEGLNIWKRLFAQGHKLLVYDNSEPGRTYTPITSEEEMMKFFKHDDRAYRRYQYVLSESEGSFCEVRHLFEFRRFGELNPRIL